MKINNPTDSNTSTGKQKKDRMRLASGPVLLITEIMVLVRLGGSDW